MYKNIEVDGVFRDIQMVQKVLTKMIKFFAGQEPGIYSIHHDFPSISAFQ